MEKFIRGVCGQRALSGGGGEAKKPFLSSQVLKVFWRKIGKREVGVAIQAIIRTVTILVYQLRDELAGEGYDESL